MFNKILIANRGEIACRVIRTAKRMAIRCIAVYSDADRHALHVSLADEAYRLGPPPATESYLDSAKIIAVATACGAEAIHPGYGFLSENPDFVEACETAGLVFIGPSARMIRAMGLKDAAKTLMETASVPVVPGYRGEQQAVDFLATRAAEIGYPVLLKARAGGGGKGMRKVETPEAFAAAFASARREAESSFADGRLLVEKYITTPRHIEVQVFGDTRGNIVHLFERDCSLQRRHQKVIEEAPAPGMTAAMRQTMGEAAVAAARAVDYVGAGTVEFIADTSEGLRADRFYFMEMNTRLQVEHPVTEAITGLDLVEWQLRVASGEPLPLGQNDIALHGHAIEARLYAENPAKKFLPATGRLQHLQLPEHRARVDTGVRAGDTITPFYDPMIAKLIVHGDSREQALNKMLTALNATRVTGCVTNTRFLARLVDHPDFRQLRFDTGLIDRELDTLISAQAADKTIVAIAALAASGWFGPVSGDDPWSTLGGWQHWGQGRQTVTLQSQTQRWRIQIIWQTATTVDIVISDDDENDIELTLECRDRTGAVLDVISAGRRLRVSVVQQDNTITVFDDTGETRFERPDVLRLAEAGAPGADQLLSPMPGKILMVNVEVGSGVKSGQPLVVMEAMKMEHVLSAPRDGVVAQLAVSVGDQVEEGIILLALEQIEETKQ